MADQGDVGPVIEQTQRLKAPADRRGMTDQATVDAQAADTDTEPQEGTDTSPGGAVDDVLTAADARKLRSEAKNLRDRLKASEQKLSERETAELTDKQRLERDLQDARNHSETLAAEMRDTRVQMIATKFGVRADRVAKVPKNLDWDQVADPDDPKHLERAVRELMKTDDYFSSTVDLDAGANGAGAGGVTDVNSIIRRAAGVRA